MTQEDQIMFWDNVAGVYTTFSATAHFYKGKATAL